MLVTLMLVFNLFQVHALDKITFDPNTIKWEKDKYSVDRNEAGKRPDMALKKLIAGNNRFIDGKSVRPRQDQAAITSTKSGQSPFAVIVGCADSRVPNEIIFDQGVGDLFIIRTAGQVSSAASYGSMEFAVTSLKTKLILVLGHTSCGAVAAAVDRPKNVPGHIVTLINEIKPAVADIQGKSGNRIENAVRQNVIRQVMKLRDLEPILSEMYAKGDIWIVGGIYNIQNGRVELIPETLSDLPKKRR